MDRLAFREKQTWAVLEAATPPQWTGWPFVKGRLGRYWIRTNDPLRVEHRPALSPIHERFHRTALIVFGRNTYGPLLFHLLYTIVA